MDDQVIMLEKQLDELRTQHRALDKQIEDADPTDQFKTLRLKKEKLKLRDLMIGIESKLYPDIIA